MELADDTFGVISGQISALSIREVRWNRPGNGVRDVRYSLFTLSGEYGHRTFFYL